MRFLKKAINSRMVAKLDLLFAGGIFLYGGMNSMWTYYAKLDDLSYVYDGDTVKNLEIDLGFKIFKRITLRLYGIDTPERRPKKKKNGKLRSKKSIELEKIKATIDAIKETKRSTDEMIQRMTEGMGELRSMVFQREGLFKDMESKIKRLEDDVSDLKPERIAKEFGKRDKNLQQNQMRLEKLENRTSNVLKILSDIRNLLKSIGGLENIAKVSRSITDKSVKIDEIAKRPKSLKHYLRKADEYENLPEALELKELSKRVLCKGEQRIG